MLLASSRERLRFSDGHCRTAYWDISQNSVLAHRWCYTTEYRWNTFMGAAASSVSPGYLTHAVHTHRVFCSVDGAKAERERANARTHIHTHRGLCECHLSRCFARFYQHWSRTFPLAPTSRLKATIDSPYSERREGHVLLALHHSVVRV